MEPQNPKYQHGTLVRIRHVCKSKLLRCVNLKLTNLQRFRIETTPFKWLLYLSNNVKSSEKLITELCSRWDEKKGGFRVGNKVVSFLPFDVCVMLGLPIVGQKIHLGEKVESKTRRLFESDNVTVSNIYDKIMKIKNDENVEDFCRLYILLGLGEFLFPNTKSYVHRGFFNILDNLDLIGNYNWGCAIYEYLIDSVCKTIFQKKNTSQIHVVGCAYLLQIWALEHSLVYPMKGLKVRIRSIFPRFLKWQDIVISKKRLTLSFERKMVYEELSLTPEELKEDVVLKGLKCGQINRLYCASFDCNKIIEEQKILKEKNKILEARLVKLEEKVRVLKDLSRMRAYVYKEAQVEDETMVQYEMQQEGILKTNNDAYSVGNLKVYSRRRDKLRKSVGSKNKKGVEKNVPFFISSKPFYSLSSLTQLSMESSVDVLTAKRPGPKGFSPGPDRDKRQKLSHVVEYGNPSTITHVWGRIEDGKFGSVTKDIEALNEKDDRDKKLVVPITEVLDDKDDRDKKSIVPFNEVLDEEDDRDKKSVVPFHEGLDEVHEEDVRGKKYTAPFHEVVLPRLVAAPPVSKTTVSQTPIPYQGESEDLKIETSMAGKGNSRGDKGAYIGVPEEEDYQVDTEDDDGLEDIWKEMSIAIECSKRSIVNEDEDPLLDTDVKKFEGCDHSFVLKDDLGYVCRVCGIIDRGIETIFEFQYKVKRNTRTYASDSWNTKEKDVFGINVAEDNLVVTELSAHPRHMKHMKPHQVEGFNFLVRNLAGDHPGGCILAHAPGSGKTFMIISFMQSFLGKYPNARPLVVLPKGILSTWKKEFQTWQVEHIPLYDLYSVKADSRSQQLVVLKKWVEQKSILFLGYRQFSSIVCDNGTKSSSLSCREILLKVPSILILDEGHTPRNEKTVAVQSLAKVQTPRKVVLSGTLYQNHVKEVFNILNLVRPKFLKMETSKSIIRRIHSRVHIPDVRSFYDLVENTLQKDKDFKRKIAVIKDLREMTSKVLHYYKGDFLDELPGLVDFTVVLTLCPRQKPEVDKLKRLSRKFEISSLGSAVYLHPKLKPLGEICGENSISDNLNYKMDDLIEKLDMRDGVKSKFYYNMLNLCESAGEKLLVFSQYLLPLKYLERLTMKWKGWSLGREIFVISGESSSEHREWSMQKLNNSPDVKVFFGSIKACGEGISLVGASRIIFLDVHLNPSVTRQAIGRAFRPGQKKKVFVYRLVAADSPEEEDQNTCFNKDLISKMWFEWNQFCGDRAFEVEEVGVKECGDLFFESPLLGEDVKALYKR